MRKSAKVAAGGVKVVHLHPLWRQGRHSGSEIEQLWRANAAIIEGMAAYAKRLEVANA